ncbi:hypothetical protein BS50DRAFT_222249 [Corynespora cassiicola Philippines]|uniref:Uncharacterized protein n=1 Tax=Corynespora cassiicola Philippines TaxID=1448308 RepID=A0A2T2N386_CORCC|nr:hypothetical protein BS50DRAFT_222249 [Corynespora cassiicola Philippines]
MLHMQFSCLKENRLLKCARIPATVIMLENEISTCFGTGCTKKCDTLLGDFR